MTLDFISLVNVIMEKEVVKELIQGDFTRTKLKNELKRILKDSNRESIFLDYYDLEKKLGGKGASAKTAKLIVDQFR